MTKSDLKITVAFFAALAFLMSSLYAAQSLAQASNQGAPEYSLSGATDSPNIPEVAMNEYLLSNAARTPLIESFGATTCVIVTIWDPATQAGILAHVSAAIDGKASLNEILTRMRSSGINPQRLQARLIGGWKGWSEGIVAGIEAGLKMNGVAVVARDVLNPNVPNLHDLQNGLTLDTKSNARGAAIKNLIFDLRSGQVISYHETVAPPEGHHEAQPDRGLLSRSRLSL